MRAIECVRKATIRDIPALKVSAIIADVSLTADPFFRKLGFVVEKEQSYPANRLFLKNYKMIKYLEYDEE